MTYRLLIALTAIVAAIPSAVSARVQTGFLDRTVNISGSAYRYQVYVPADFQSKKSWPVILFLHGSGKIPSDSPSLSSSRSAART
jgi:predicted peptidase